MGETAPPHPATAPESAMRRNKTLEPLQAPSLATGAGARDGPFARRQPLPVSKFAGAQRSALGGSEMKASLEHSAGFPGARAMKAGAVPPLATGQVALRRPALDDSGALLQLSSRVREACQEEKKGRKKGASKRRSAANPSEAASGVSSQRSHESYEGLTTTEILERERQKRLEKKWHPLSQGKKDSYGPPAARVADEDQVCLGSPSMQTGMSGASSRFSAMRKENETLQQQNEAFRRMNEENKRLKEENERMKMQAMEQLARGEMRRHAEAENMVPGRRRGGPAAGLPPMPAVGKERSSRPRLEPIHSNQRVTHQRIF